MQSETARQFKLFISYAHEDLRPYTGYKDSRVGVILETIKRELGCHSSRARFKILRDAELIRPSDNFRHKIAEFIEDCDIAIAFLSQEYWDSEECEAELRQLVARKKPLFLIETENVLFGDHAHRIGDIRAAIKDILHVEFWGTDKDHKPIRYGHPLPYLDSSTYRNEYQSAVDRVVVSIKERARTLLGSVPRGEDEHKPVLERYRVFMASPASDTRPETKQLIKTLEDDGHSVLAFDPALDVLNGQSFDVAMSGALDKCAIYVQLLGGLPGRTAPGSDAGLVRAQYEIAAKSGKPIYMWRSDFDPTECAADHAAFLSKLALTNHLSSFVDFKDFLLKKVRDIAKQEQSDQRRVERAEAQEAKAQAVSAGARTPAAPEQVQEPRALLSLGIDAAQEDHDLAQKLHEAFARYIDVGALPYALGSSELAAAVADNDAIVLAYGKSAEGQKRALAHFKIIRRQVVSAGPKKLNLAVGNGAPPTAPPCPRGPGVDVISIADEVDTGAMLAFLSRLGITVPQGEAR